MTTATFACLVAVLCLSAQGAGLKLYVAPNGDDGWSGRMASIGEGDGPFRTLQRARDEVRRLRAQGALPAGQVTIELAPGVYELSAPLELTEEDSGTAQAPLIIRGRPGEEVRLVGGVEITNFAPVTDPAVLARMDDGARGNVVQADLRALGVTDFGEVATSGQRLELFFQDRPMRVARWPNEGFTRIVDVVGGAPHQILGVPGDKIGMFVYDGDRPERWVNEPDVWLHGYWFWDWADQRQRVESIDVETRTITLHPPYHLYGYRKNQWYYAFNLLPELDMPGEYYVDRQAGVLYFWPPAPLSQGRALVSVAPSLVNMSGASHVTLRGLILEATRSTAVTVSGGTDVRIVGCTLRNTGDGAVIISGGTNHGVVGCDIYETAGFGISMGGGDRNTLTPCGHYAVNNHIHDYARLNRMYNPGISLSGVGCRAAHNLISHAPNMAIYFSGNDHVIEFNEIHSVCYESNDAGAIYAGRDWSMRGTVIRYNYLHHILGFEGRGCMGVYLDDQFSGTTIYGNVFYQVSRAARIAGGRDCRIENNIFVDCVPAVNVDAIGLRWAAGGFEGLKSLLDKLPYKEEPWASRYPELVNILQEDPMAPRGNVIARNICVGGRWGDFDPLALPMIRFEDNLLEQDPCFVNHAHLNFQLRDDSPALKLGFQRIPMRLIGLVDDETRASWPVVDQVRPISTASLPPPRLERSEPEPSRSGPLPVYKVERAKVPITIDGAITPQEWNGADPAKAMVMEQNEFGEKVAPRSLAWLAYDDEALYVAVDNAVNPDAPLGQDNVWGRDDAVEVAVRNPAAGDKAPILVLRGYPTGHFESSGEAGAPPEAVKRAAEEVQFRAQTPKPGQWTAEWRIPFASLGVDPTQHTKLAFNLSARKSAESVWVLWQGTGGCTWEADRAGFVELQR